jgi:hypothetical protein
MIRATTMQPSRDAPLPNAACPSCGRDLHFVRSVPRTDGLRELQTYSCRDCSLWVTESADENSFWNKKHA